MPGSLSLNLGSTRNRPDATFNLVPQALIDVQRLDRFPG
jgi:hypothetical protein